MEIQRKPTGLLRYASMIGTVGAVVQIGWGIDELRHAEDTPQRVNATVDIGTGFTRGVAATLSFGALLAAATHFPCLAHAFTTAAGFQGAAFFLDGCRDLYNHDKPSGTLKLTSASIAAAGLALGSTPCMLVGYTLCDAVTIVQNRKSVAQAVRSGWRAIVGG